MEILERKMLAVEEFKRKILTNDIKKYVGKIVLFGSVLKGTEKEDSDIDLLVLAVDSPEKVVSYCSKISYEIMLDLGEGIESVVHCIDEWRVPSSYLVYVVKKTGKEVYNMDVKEIKQKESIGYLTLSERYLDSAKRIFNEKDYRIAIDVGYNSAELCVKGLLLFVMDDIPSSHRGVVNKFGEFYIKIGKVSKEFGNILNEGLDLRNKARYEPHFEADRKDAEKIIKLAEKLNNILSDKVY